MQIIDKAANSETEEEVLIIEQDNYLFMMPESGYMEEVEIKKDIKKLENNEKEKKKDNVKGIYKHFKGKEYEVLGVAYSADTLEKFVYYKPLYENSKHNAWIRPYDMFFSKVDKERYIDAIQEYRFEKIR